MRHRKAITIEIKDKYSKVSKKGRTKIFDKFTATTGYNHDYAARILRLKAGGNLQCQYIDDRIKAKLKRKISKLLDKSLELNSLGKTLKRNSTVDEKPYEYIYR